MRLEYGVQLLTSAARQYQDRRNAQPAQNKRSGRGWNVNTRNGLFSAGPIAKKNVSNVFRPFAMWDTEVLRSFSKQILLGKGVPNPTKGEVNQMLHELWDMPACRLQELINTSL